VAPVGLADARSVDRLQIDWPDGCRTTVRDIAVNQRVRVYPNGTARRVPSGMTWMELDEEDMP
jgi:hypothetical protein